MYPGSELHVSSLWDLQTASPVALKPPFTQLSYLHLSVILTQYPGVW